jgi:hypothetical protein
MKRYLLLVLSFVFFIASQAMGAVYYVDFENGNDTTGDGTYGTPWATIEKCTTSGATTGGDECRVAKHTPTALSGTLTFTNQSKAVPTSVDLTGTVSAGDYVGLNATDESWWRVASLTSSEITLDYEYWGPGTAVASTGYLANYTMLSGDVDMENSGTSTASRIIVSGGWDLSTQTQDGMTFLSNYGQNFYIVSFNGESYIEFSDFVLLAANSASYSKMETTSAAGLKFDNLIQVNYSFSIASSGTINDWLEYSNILQSGGGARGFNFTSSDFIKATNLISYSAGAEGTNNGIDINSNFLIIDGLEIYNTGYQIMTVTGDFQSYKNVILDTNNYADISGLVLTNIQNMTIDGIQIKNTTGNGIYSSGEITDFYINNPTFTNIGGSSNQLFYFGASEVHGPPIYMSNYGGTAGDDRIYFKAYDPGNYIQRDTTDARSGSCLKFYAVTSGWPISYKVGTHKVEDGSSNVVLSVYMKDNAGFNGSVFLTPQIGKQFTAFPAEKTMTTSYAQYSVTINSADIETGDYVSLWVGVKGSAGNVFVDDFNAAQ